MSIDTSIYNNIQQPRPDSQLNALAQMAQLQQAQNQNKLFDLSFAEKQREVGADNALAGMLTKKATPDEITQGLASQGYGAKALAYQKMLQERQKAEAELKGANLGNDTKQYELDQKKRIASIQSNAALITDPNFSYEKFVQHVQQAVNRGETKPEQALQFIQQAPQDPVQLKAMLTQHLIQSLAPEKQLEAIQPKVEMKDTGGALTGIQMNPNLPGYGQPMQGRQVAKSQSPDSVASNATTRRGQDMTDARDREKIAQGKAPTEFQGKSGAFGARAQEADRIISSLYGKYNPAAVNSKVAVESTPLIGGILGAATNKMALSESDQQAEQAQRDFINAVLRQESGASIGASEFDNARKQYFPQPGDKPGVITQKEANRKLAIRGLLNNAGPGAKNMAAPAQASGGWSIVEVK